jgi:hypothetical protein
MMHERNMLGELLTIKGSERHAMVQSGTYSPPAQTAEEEAAETAEIIKFISVFASWRIEFAHDTVFRSR